MANLRIPMANTNESLDISGKNTKNEILEAYNALLAKIKETKPANPQELKKQRDDEEIVKKATATSGDRITKNLMELKVSLNQELDALEQKVTTEYRQLTDLQAAIKVESATLRDLYDINKDADSLAALLLAQKECKIRFDNEMALRKKELEQEIEQTQLQWNRQEEEYAYTLKIERKKDKDIYEARKAALEKDLVEQRAAFNKEIADREASLKAGEEELLTLRKRVDQFPAELEKAVKDAERTTRESIEMRYKHQIDLTAKEVDGERKLSQQTIISLKEKIQEQDEYIQQLTQKANDSTLQVQSIAMKAIEGASNMRFFSSVDDIKKTSHQNL